MTYDDKVTELFVYVYVSAYFSVYYYIKCVFLKAGCATLKRKMCNIKLKEATQTIHHFVQKL